MSLKLSDLARRLFRGPAHRPTKPPALRVESLEDRAVPSTVTVARMANAVEGGDDGVFRFTRTGSTSQSLVVHYSVGGTATAGTDYTSLSGTVTIPANSSTVDLPVAAADDTVYDPDETVTVTVTDPEPGT